MAFKSNFLIGCDYLSRLNKADEFGLGDVGCVPLAGEWGVNLRVAPPSLLADNFAAVMRLEVDGAFIPDKVLAPAVEGQVWSLTQFYSVDFSKSRMGEKMCVFNKRTIKVFVDGALGPPRLVQQT